MTYIEEISRSKPKARKQHRCIWCGEPIMVGEVHEHSVSKYMSDLQDHRFHLECVKPCEEGCAEMDGEFMPYENERGKEATP
jgi:hypothetical protein